MLCKWVGMRWNNIDLLEFFLRKLLISQWKIDNDWNDKKWQAPSADPIQILFDYDWD